MNKYNEDDYCDLYSNKICDNCGKCLEEQGIDVRAINIEEIAKTVEENEYLEEEFKKSINEKEFENKEDLILTAEDFLKDEGFNEYIDAFENVEYIEDIEVLGEGTLDDLTEEIFPGVRKLKR
ncbi:hypothetical protein JCM1393_27070 [Clostridium carnis]